MRTPNRRDEGDVLVRTVTGKVAFRDIGPVAPPGAVIRAGRVTHVTGSDQLPFGRDENQAKTYDD
jgi:hypothetical protein